MQFPLVPPNFTSALATTRGLRDFYYAKVIEYSQLLEQAKSQLVHAEALLAGLEQLQVEPRSYEPSIINAATEANGKNGTSNNGFSSHQLAVELNATKLEQTVALTTIVPSQGVELLPPYHEQDLPSALASLLQCHTGTILKLDFIVRTLYGKLTPEQFETIRVRVFQVLEQGVSEGRWHKDPYPHANNTDCYTWSLESLDDEFINNEEKEVEDVANNSETLFDPNEVVNIADILQLVESGVLTIVKMKQLAKELRLLSYGTIKYPQSFASYFVKNGLTRGTLQRFIELN
ncbi:MAG TPA: hypothetical protein V6D15_00300 [Oculatellaceae cyanobacterium]|jgi:hypothetical protein